MSPADRDGLTRRGFLRVAAATGAAALLPGACSPAQTIPPAYDLVDWPLITPTEALYLTHLEAPDPPLHNFTWSLRVHGAVDAPLTLTYDELINLPAIEAVTTLVCIGNAVGGGSIGTVAWRGVPLTEILGRVGVRPEALDIVSRGVNGYGDSIPLTHANAHLVLLAYEMNGAVLTDLHGYPLRVVAPGLYGVKSVKWLSEIELVDYDYRGYWQTTDGWSESAHVRTLAQIVNVPPNFHTPPRQLTVDGFAYAGLRGISRVELSTDGGRTWADATLDPPPSAYSWRRWERAIDLQTPGTRELVVRATDGDGALMQARDGDGKDGWEGWHRVSVTVTQDVPVR